MKNYKIVSVYSGYGEMSINGVSNEKSESLKEVCIDLLKKKKKLFEEEGDDSDMSYFEEFVNSWGVKGKLGSVGDGEEGFDLIVEEGSDWYGKVNGYDDWSENEWNEWVNFCSEGIESDEEGKI